MDIPCEIQIEIVLKILSWQRTGLDLRQVQPGHSKPLEHAGEGSRHMGQGKAQADLVGVLGQDCVP